MRIRHAEEHPLSNLGWARLGQAAHVFGVDYAGVLQRDGRQSYPQFTRAAHHTCVEHLLRRCRVLMLDYPAQPFVMAVKAVLQG